MPRRRLRLSPQSRLLSGQRLETYESPALGSLDSLVTKVQWAVRWLAPPRVPKACSPSCVLLAVQHPVSDRLRLSLTAHGSIVRQRTRPEQFRLLAAAEISTPSSDGSHPPRLGCRRCIRQQIQLKWPNLLRPGDAVSVRDDELPAPACVDYAEYRTAQPRLIPALRSNLRAAGGAGHRSPIEHAAHTRRLVNRHCTPSASQRFLRWHRSTLTAISDCHSN